jgi:hypothetical protein
MTLVVYVGAQLILVDNYEALEKQRAEMNVKRCLNALSNELAELDSTATDWAAWDDTYAFIQDANDNYLKSNLVSDTFVNLRLNMMVFINSTGNIVYGKAFDLQNMTETPVPQDMLQLLSANTFLWYHSATESSLTGMGISEENLKKLFGPLFTTKAKGMGLGLSICKRVVEAHGGTISVESIIDKGTTFTIIVPIEPKLDEN